MSAIPSLSLSVGWLGFNVAFNNSYCACSLSLNSLHVNLSVPPYQCQKIMPGNFHYQALLASIIDNFIQVHYHLYQFTSCEIQPSLLLKLIHVYGTVFLHNVHRLDLSLDTIHPKMKTYFTVRETSA